MSVTSGMGPDDEVCLCFHVTRRRLEKFVRFERPVRVSQMSQCDGAGTGCRWCVPILAKIFERQSDALPSAADHRSGRTRYRQQLSGDAETG